MNSRRNPGSDNLHIFADLVTTLFVLNLDSQPGPFFSSVEKGLLPIDVKSKEYNPSILSSQLQHMLPSHLRHFRRIHIRRFFVHLLFSFFL